MDSYESLNAASLAETIREEFKDADRPVTIRDVADLYGLVAAQHEATLAVYALAMKANPGIIFTDEATEAKRAIEQTVDVFLEAIRSLARAAGIEVDNGG